MFESLCDMTKPIAFIRAEPQLFVTDLPRALAFFHDQLGFETQFVFGDPPYYAQVARGGSRLNLRHVDEPGIDPKEEQLLAATICVESIEALFQEYQARGVEFHQELREEPWGARNFIVRDPDGGLLLFAE